MLLKRGTSKNKNRIVNGTPLKFVSDFKYLCSYITDIKNDFQRQQNFCLVSLQQISPDVLISKLQKYQNSLLSSVGSNFLYRAETQSVKKDFEKRLDVSTNSC